MPNSVITIKRMTIAELKIAIEWAAQEGWNPGLYDAEAYYSADPNGYLMGYLNEQPIACISVVKYNEQFGFLGFYIVRPEYRGQGYGWKIWQAGMEYLKACNVGLDGVVDQQENYKKSGFKLAYRNIRFEGKPISPSNSKYSLTPIQQIPFSLIQEFEKNFFPAERNRFLEKWIQLPDAFGYGILEEGNLMAYSIIRKCREGYKVAPLFAENVEQAEMLLAGLSQQVKPHEKLYIDVPEIHTIAVDWIQSHGFKMVFETARMYTGALPKLPIHQIFGITSFEIG
jgi:GNAT superfamily N-acetyltransferase